MKNLSNRSRQLMDVERYQEAIGLLTQILAIDKSKTSAYLSRGLCHMRSGDYKLALADANAYIRINPKEPSGYILRGRCRDQEDGLAERDFATALKLDPDCSDAYRYRGEFYLSTGENQKAADDLTKAMLGSPDTPSLYRYRSMAYSALKKHDLAIKDLTDDIRLSKRPFSYLARAHEYAALGDYARALKDFDEALKTSDDTKRYPLIIERSRLLCKMKQHEKAIADINSVLTKSPKDYELYKIRGDEYMHLEKWESAAKDYSVVIELAPEYLAGYKQRALAYEKLGKKDRAKADQQRARTIEEHLF